MQDVTTLLAHSFPAHLEQRISRHECSSNQQAHLHNYRNRHQTSWNAADMFQSTQQQAVVGLGRTKKGHLLDNGNRNNALDASSTKASEKSKHQQISRQYRKHVSHASMLQCSVTLYHGQSPFSFYLEQTRLHMQPSERDLGTTRPSEAAGNHPTTPQP